MAVHYLYAIAPISYHRPLLKIGISSDVRKRLAQLHTSSPLPLSVLAAWEFMSLRDAKAIESTAHVFFKRKQSHLEWFHIAVDEVDKFISSGPVLHPYTRAFSFTYTPAARRLTDAQVAVIAARRVSLRLKQKPKPKLVDFAAAAKAIGESSALLFDAPAIPVAAGKPALRAKKSAVVEQILARRREQIAA